MTDASTHRARSIVLASITLALTVLVSWLILRGASTGTTEPVLGIEPATTSPGEAAADDAAGREALATDATELVPSSEATDSTESEVRRDEVERSGRDLVTLRGRVVDRTGRGIEGVAVIADVHLFPLPKRRHRTRTDRAGQFVFDQVLPGRFILSFAHLDYCDATLRPRLIELGERVELEDVCLFAGATVSGVLHVGGRAAPGMTVYALAERKELRRSESKMTLVDADGSFSFSEPFAPGRYRILVGRHARALPGALWSAPGSRTIVRELVVTPTERECYLRLELEE